MPRKYYLPWNLCKFYTEVYMEGVTNTPANIYGWKLKVDNRTPEKGIKYVQYVKTSLTSFWFFSVNFGHIWHLFLFLLTLRKHFACWDYFDLLPFANYPHALSPCLEGITQLAFTCSKSKIETQEKGVKICSKLTTKTPF